MEDVKIRVIDSDKLVNAINEGSYDVNLSSVMALGAVMLDTKKLPPAPPEYVTGFWLIRHWRDDAKCSNCGKTFKDVYDMDSHDAFCRCCGAKMEGLRVII